MVNYFIHHLNHYQSIESMNNNVKRSPDDKYVHSHTFINRDGELIYAGKCIQGIHAGFFFNKNLYWIIIEN